MRYFLVTMLLALALSSIHAAEPKPARFIQTLQAGHKVTIVTLGTSLTGGTWRWPDVMKEWLDKDFPGLVTLHNLGVGASASSHPPGHSGLDTSKRGAALKPDVVFIEFTTNDAYLPYKISEESSQKNLNTMIDTILAANPKPEIVLLTMNSVKDNPKAGAGNLHASTRPELAKYAQGYRDVAKQRGLLLVDNYPNWLKIMTDDLERFDRLVPDRIHPQLEGYRQVVLPALKETLLGQGGGKHGCLPELVELSQTTRPWVQCGVHHQNLLLSTAMKLTPLIVGLVLAAASFAYGRHHYVNQNTATFTTGKSSGSITNPLADKHLFGHWVKEEWLFAIAIPAAFVAGGAVWATKK